MNVLVIGSGGREHVLTWKLALSPRLKKLFIAPGNPGTAKIGQNVPIDISNHSELVKFGQSEKIDLVIIGPEIPLAAGLTDAFLTAGINVFGPNQQAAQIESSKSFSKDFMARHHIPTASYARFTQFDQAVNYLKNTSAPIVIKASGLAAGKGVILPETLDEGIAALKSIMVERVFGNSGDEVVIEERLYGQEVSLMAFTDGATIIPMLPAQDHKRLLDNDMGPNTGGMGAYAPAPICTPDMISQVTRTILQPTIDGLRSENILFRGVLYAGLILTKDGPKVLEYNCRFGDPETQVVLPLLASDLLGVTEACASGNLDKTKVEWHDGSAVCVVVASQGYPARVIDGKPIHGLDKLPKNAECFHAGTSQKGSEIISSGGRVLGIVGWANNFEKARENAYLAVEKINFEGMQYRKDIGHHALALLNARENSAYAQSGVDISAGNRAVELMKKAVQSTYSPAVLAGIGAFGGAFDASLLKTYDRPVLIASTDGVGTKVKMASQYGMYQSIGHDIVNHCIDDILVQGAIPLFFLDYFASSKLTPEIVASVVTGISEACLEAGIAVLGGETAEMPGVYQPSEFDLAGTIVGLLEYKQMLPRTAEIQNGDLLVGLRSSGPHTNGYSLIRKIFENTDLTVVHPALGKSLVNALLAPHRSYLQVIHPVLKKSPGLIKALAHITGGGFIENIPRILPPNLNALINTSGWEIPALFKLIQKEGNISSEEMYRVFNMGIGMVAVINHNDFDQLVSLIPESIFIVGELVDGNKKVVLK